MTSFDKDVTTAGESMTCREIATLERWPVGSSQEVEESRRQWKLSTNEHDEKYSDQPPLQFLPRPPRPTTAPTTTQPAPSKEALQLGQLVREDLDRRVTALHSALRGPQPESEAESFSDDGTTTAAESETTRSDLSDNNSRPSSSRRRRGGSPREGAGHSSEERTERSQRRRRRSSSIVKRRKAMYSQLKTPIISTPHDPKVIIPSSQVFEGGDPRDRVEVLVKKQRSKLLSEARLAKKEKKETALLGGGGRKASSLQASQHSTPKQEGAGPTTLSSARLPTRPSSGASSVFGGAASSRAETRSATSRPATGKSLLFASKGKGETGDDRSPVMSTTNISSLNTGATPPGMLPLAARLGSASSGRTNVQGNLFTKVVSRPVTAESIKSKASSVATKDFLLCTYSPRGREASLQPPSVPYSSSLMIPRSFHDQMMMEIMEEMVADFRNRIRDIQEKVSAEFPTVVLREPLPPPIPHLEAKQPAAPILAGSDDHQTSSSTATAAPPTTKKASLPKFNPKKMMADEKQRIKDREKDLLERKKALAKKENLRKKSLDSIGEKRRVGSESPPTATTRTRTSSKVLKTQIIPSSDGQDGIRQETKKSAKKEVETKSARSTPERHQNAAHHGEKLSPNAGHSKLPSISTESSLPSQTKHQPQPQHRSMSMSNTLSELNVTVTSTTTTTSSTIQAPPSGVLVDEKNPLTAQPLSTAAAPHPSSLSQGNDKDTSTPSTYDPTNNSQAPPPSLQKDSSLVSAIGAEDSGSASFSRLPSSNSFSKVSPLPSGVVAASSPSLPKTASLKLLRRRSDLEEQRMTLDQKLNRLSALIREKKVKDKEDQDLKEAESDIPLSIPKLGSFSTLTTVESTTEQQTLSPSRSSISAKKVGGAGLQEGEDSQHLSVISGTPRKSSISGRRSVSRNEHSRMSLTSTTQQQRSPSRGSASGPAPSQPAVEELPADVALALATELKDALQAAPRDLLNIHSLRINTTKRLKAKKVDIERNRNEAEVRDRKRESDVSAHGVPSGHTSITPPTTPTSIGGDKTLVEKAATAAQELFLPSRKQFYSTLGDLLTPPLVGKNVKKIQKDRQEAKNCIEDVKTLRTKLRIAKKKDIGSSLVSIPYEVISGEVLMNFERENDARIRDDTEKEKALMGSTDDRHASSLSARRVNISQGAKSNRRGTMNSSFSSSFEKLAAGTVILSNVKLGEEKHRLLVECGLVENIAPKKVGNVDESAVRAPSKTRTEERQAEDKEVEIIASGKRDGDKGMASATAGVDQLAEADLGRIAKKKLTALGAITSMAVNRQTALHQQQLRQQGENGGGAPLLYRDVAVQNVLSDEASIYRHARATAMFKKEDAIRSAVHTLQVGMSNISAYLEGAEVDLTCHRCWSILKNPQIVSPCGVSYCRRCLIPGGDELPLGGEHHQGNQSQSVLGIIPDGMSSRTIVNNAMKDSQEENPLQDLTVSEHGGGGSQRQEEYHTTSTNSATQEQHFLEQHQQQPDFLQGLTQSMFSTRKLVCGCVQHDGSAPNPTLEHVIQRWKVESQPRLLADLDGQLQGLVNIIGSSTTSRRPGFVGGLIGKLRSDEAAEKARNSRLRLTHSGVAISDPHR